MIKYVHTNIIAEDWKQLSQFYIDVFNCTMVPPQRDQERDWLSRGTGVKNAKLAGVHLRLPGYGNQGPTLEIYQYTEVVPLKPVAPNQRGLGHLAFEVSTIEDLINKVIAHGGTTHGSLTIKEIEGVGVLSFIYARDIEGNLIELQSWET